MDCATDGTHTTRPVSSALFGLLVLLLANPTAYVVIRDGDTLVKIVDEATRAIAEGYTLGTDPRAKQKFTDAAALLQEYAEKVQASRARGNMPVETETLLVDQAKTLMELLRKL